MNRRRWLWNASLYDSKTTSTSKQHYYQPTLLHPSHSFSLARPLPIRPLLHTHHPPLVTHWLRARGIRIVFSVSRFCLIQRVQPFFFSLHFLHFFFSRFRLKMSKIIINLFVINERQLINHFGSLFRFSSVFSGRALRSLSGVFTVSQYRPAKSKWNIYKYFIACECGDSATGLLLVLRSSTDSFAHAHMLWQPPECWFDCRNTHYPMIII